MIDRQRKFDAYLAYQSLNHLNQDHQIDAVGELIDLSFELKRVDGAKKAIELANSINKDDLTPSNFIVLHYNLANAWQAIRVITRHTTTADWDFEQEELGQEIINLRTAANHPAFSKLAKDRQCQILTNLGNHFSYIGRFVEAQGFWSQAIATIPKFAMAIGNKGFGLIQYGKTERDNFSPLFFNIGYYLLQKALSLRKYLEPGAAEYFEQAVAELEENLSSKLLHAELDLSTEYSLGETGSEQRYRKWSLENTLFLHPVNDITVENYAAHDCLMIPPILAPVNTPPLYHNFYNQIKQEYVAARYFLFEGINCKGIHIADKGVQLTDTHEVLAYSINTEKVKIAYRICYSLFDKIAYFLNSYLNLSIPERQVNFRTMWYSGNKVLRPEFAKSTNWPLRGLFWVSKDLFDENLQDTIEPEGKELAKIRNFMEHKSLRIKQSDVELPFVVPDQISHTISRQALEAKTLKVMKLSRAAILYLTYAIANIEIEKSKNIDQSKVGTFSFGTYPERNKI